MIRKLLIALFAATLALMLAGCGSVGGVASSIIAPCDQVIYEQIAWSPDGKHIAYQADTPVQGSPTGAPPELVVMDANRLGIVEFSRRLPLHARDLQWLPDSQSLAYTDLNKVITIALDGTTTEIDIPAIQLNDLLFSPDGRTIAFQRYSRIDETSSEWGGIQRINRDGSGLIELTANGNDTLEQWSPDGEYIAVTKFGGFVYIIRSDGSDKRNLGKGTGPVRWSPDGTWISFFSTADNSLHVVRPDGTDERLVTNDIFSYPSSWLPDGQHISFARYADHNLSVIDLNTSAVETLTTSRVLFDIPAAWSPDGSRAAFVTWDSSTNSYTFQEIYVINRDGSGATRISDNPGRYQCFNWPF